MNKYTVIDIVYAIAPVIAVAIAAYLSVKLT